MNVVSPFINDARNQIDGYTIQLLRNQNVSKRQHFKSADELLPYLKEYPEYLEHPTVKKAFELIKNCHSDELMAELLEKIKEEIELEISKDEPDEYVISRLSEIYQNHSKVAN
ncbi:hypothetical protein V4F87_003261 [Vibrio parahaemolyticus]|nr:hypothetical protein [Vibrio parahaemolyticus]